MSTGHVYKVMEEHIPCQPSKETGVPLLRLLLFLSLIGSSHVSASNVGSIKASGKVFFVPTVGAFRREVVLAEGTKITVKYMEEPMNDSSDRSIIRRHAPVNEHGLVYKHDYVVYGYSNHHDMTWIKAEKGGNTGSKTADAGIYIYLEWTEPTSGTVRYELRDFSLCSGREMWTVGQVLDIFTAQEPDYNLFSKNCWLFSMKSTEAILNWLKSNALDGCKKSDLEQELEKLKVVTRTMPIDLLKLALYPTPHPDRVTIARHFREQAARTRKKLPDNARWRRVGCALAIWFVDFQLGTQLSPLYTLLCTILSIFSLRTCILSIRRKRELEEASRREHNLNPMVQQPLRAGIHAGSVPVEHTKQQRVHRVGHTEVPLEFRSGGLHFDQFPVAIDTGFLSSPTSPMIGQVLEWDPTV